ENLNLTKKTVSYFNKRAQIEETLLIPDYLYGSRQGIKYRSKAFVIKAFSAEKR
ncbi:hypothetical protein ACOME3_010615, partial [Neoechinorhynchus agilis]